MYIITAQKSSMLKDMLYKKGLNSAIPKGAKPCHTKKGLNSSIPKGTKQYHTKRD